MKIAITGASGMIGSALSTFLAAGGHQVVPMVRRGAGPGEIAWDPASGAVDAAALRGIDAVIHLAAEPIEARPLTAGKRRRLRDSRVKGTAAVATALAGMEDGPRILLSASGTNWYGDRGDEILTEASEAGSSGLLCDIARDWEDATAPARRAGVRVVLVRTGIVLDRDATVMKTLGTVARLGGAAPLGTGRQYWPWVSIRDTVGLYHHTLTTPEIEGPFNACSPEPVTNETFTRTLARVLHRPVLPIRVPRLAPSLLLRKELADSLLFTSMRVLPAKAAETGYTFTHPELEDALRALYGR